MSIYPAYHYSKDEKDDFIKKIESFKRLGSKGKEWVRIVKKGDAEYTFKLTHKTCWLGRVFHHLFGKSKTLRYKNVGKFLTEFLKKNQDRFEGLTIDELKPIKKDLLKLKRLFIENKKLTVQIDLLIVAISEIGTKNIKVDNQNEEAKQKYEKSAKAAKELEQPLQKRDQIIEDAKKDIEESKKIREDVKKVEKKIKKDVEYVKKAKKFEALSQEQIKELEVQAILGSISIHNKKLKWISENQEEDFIKFFKSGDFKSLTLEQAKVVPFEKILELSQDKMEAFFHAHLSCFTDLDKVNLNQLLIKFSNSEIFSNLKDKQIQNLDPSSISSFQFETIFKSVDRIKILEDDQIFKLAKFMTKDHFNELTDTQAKNFPFETLKSLSDQQIRAFLDKHERMYIKQLNESELDQLITEFPGFVELYFITDEQVKNIKPTIDKDSFKQIFGERFTGSQIKRVSFLPDPQPFFPLFDKFQFDGLSDQQIKKLNFKEITKTSYLRQILYKPERYKLLSKEQILEIVSELKQEDFSNFDSEQLKVFDMSLLITLKETQVVDFYKAFPEEFKKLNKDDLNKLIEKFPNLKSLTS